MTRERGKESSDSKSGDGDDKDSDDGLGVTRGCIVNDSGRIDAEDNGGHSKGKDDCNEDAGSNVGHNGDGND